jgi:glycosyltransferase involved in cell wall biosynthesis
MSITIVICTRDRPAQLQRCLARLQPQIDAQSELLVVASAPTDNAAYWLVEKVKARYVPEACPGLDVARNTAIRHANGEIIAFIDDDVQVAPGWLLALQAAFADETVDCVTGRVLPTSLDAPAQQHFETRFSFDRGSEPKRFTGKDQHPWFPIHPYHLGAGANMAFRRHVFDRIGLFDESLDAGTPTGGGGDLDIFRRLLLAGFTAVYEPNLLAYHEHRSASAAANKQFYAYGKTFSALMTKIWFEEPALKRQVPRLCRQQTVLLLRHLWQRLSQRTTTVPLMLTLLEAAGNVMGPWAYLQALHQTKARRQKEWPAAIKRLAAPGSTISGQRLQKLAAFIQPNPHFAAESEQAGWDQPTVAVIICTRDRPKALHTCLQSLAASRPFLAQLIVVDNGLNPAETAALTSEFDGQMLLEPHPGLCRARNRGLAAAKADIVAYLDDDVVIESGWLETLTAVYAQNKDVAGVMGLVLPGQLETADQKLFEWALGGLGRGFARRVYRGFAARKAAPQIGAGANMSFRRQPLLRVGGFDEALDPGTPAQAGGDIDIFFRLLKANGTLIYEPAAAVWHTHRREVGQARTLSAAYGKGTAAAYAKWAAQGDWTAVRMLLGLWFRYYPAQLWQATTRAHPITPALAWAGWRSSWQGPWAYLKGRQAVRKTDKVLRHPAAASAPPSTGDMSVGC